MGVEVGNVGREYSKRKKLNRRSTARISIANYVSIRNVNAMDRELLRTVEDN